MSEAANPAEFLREGAQYDSERDGLCNRNHPHPGITETNRRAYERACLVTEVMGVKTHNQNKQTGVQGTHSKNTLIYTGNK